MPVLTEGDLDIVGRIGVASNLTLVCEIAAPNPTVPRCGWCTSRYAVNDRCGTSPTAPWPGAKWRRI